jgi:hypothetical protein
MRYLNEIPHKCEMEEIKGRQISRNRCVNRLPFADDQIIMSNSDDELQISAHKLNTLIYKYGMTISAHKKKRKKERKTFFGPESKRNEIVTIK